MRSYHSIIDAVTMKSTTGRKQLFLCCSFSKRHTSCQLLKSRTVVEQIFNALSNKMKTDWKFIKASIYDCFFFSGCCFRNLSILHVRFVLCILLINRTHWIIQVYSSTLCGKNIRTLGCINTEVEHNSFNIIANRGYSII